MQPKDRLLLQGLTCILTQKSYRCKLRIHSRYEHMHKDDSWKWKSCLKHRQRRLNVCRLRENSTSRLLTSRKRHQSVSSAACRGQRLCCGCREFRVGGWSESKHTVRCLTSATSFRLTKCFPSGLVLSAVHPETPLWSLKRKKNNTLLKPFGLCSHAETGGWWWWW